MRDTRRMILGAFGMVAPALLSVSIAYACTVYQGAFTVTLGGAGGYGTQTVYGDASMVAQEMYWCTNSANGTGVPDNEPTWGALSMSHNTITSITIAMADATNYDPECVGANGLNKIKDGDGYQLDWHAGLMPAGGTPNHCGHLQPTSNRIAKKISVVNGAGASGPHNFQTTGQNPGYISICLYDDRNRPDGNAVNIDVL